MSEPQSAYEEADVLARLTGMTELALHVAPDHALGCITIEVGGLHGAYQAVLARNHALDLANRILHACIALKPPEQPPDGAGPLSSTY